jgi:hypothetical protein
MSEQKERVIRNYDIPLDLFVWLEGKAAREKRPVVRQVEVILEEARARDEKNAKGA